MTGVEASIKILVSYLKTAIPTLGAVYEDWPNASQNLKIPSITILTSEPKFTQFENYVISKNEDPEIDGKVKYRKVIGAFDLVFKAHLWSDSKPGRQNLFELFMGAMNPHKDTSGLRLKSTAYFDEWITFDVSNIAFVDNEESSQRSEKRCIVDILVNVRSVIETSDYLIETIENNLETPDTIPSSVENNETTII